MKIVLLPLLLKKTLNSTKSTVTGERGEEEVFLCLGASKCVLLAGSLGLSFKRFGCATYKGIPFDTI